MASRLTDPTLWCEKLTHHHIPRWAELPEIDLYMDQVVLLVERFLQIYLPAEEKFITSAMINNYVKSKILPPPVKKRYSRAHIAYLVFICMLKQVLSISEIHTLLIKDTNEEALPAVYDTFCAAQEKAHALLVRAWIETPQMFTGSADALPNGDALNMSMLAGAAKTIAQQLLPTQEENQKG